MKSNNLVLKFMCNKHLYWKPCDFCIDTYIRLSRVLRIYIIYFYFLAFHFHSFIVLLFENVHLCICEKLYKHKWSFYFSFAYMKVDLIFIFFRTYQRCIEKRPPWFRASDWWCDCIYLHRLCSSSRWWTWFIVNILRSCWII